jgi:hypothetical protein
VIVDRQQGLFGRPTTPFSAEYGDHPITRDLGDVTLFHVVRSVLPAASAANAIAPIVRTGDQSWAERDMERVLTKGEAEYNAGTDLKGSRRSRWFGTVQLGPRLRRRLRRDAARAEDCLAGRVRRPDFASNQRRRVPQHPFVNP